MVNPYLNIGLIGLDEVCVSNALLEKSYKVSKTIERKVLFRITIIYYYFNPSDFWEIFNYSEVYSLVENIKLGKFF